MINDEPPLFYVGMKHKFGVGKVKTVADYATVFTQRVIRVSPWVALHSRLLASPPIPRLHSGQVFRTANWVKLIPYPELTIRQSEKLLAFAV